MTTLYRNRAGTDFDDLFERDPAGIAIAGFNDELGNPLLFASLEFGSKIADVESYHPEPPHLDVTNYWAGKGTVVYVNPTALPSTLAIVNEGSPPSVSATVSFHYLRNGTLNLSPGTPTFWSTVQTPTIGDGYDIRFTLISGNTAGTLSGQFDQWLQLNATRGVSLSITVSQAVAVRASRYIKVEIRRRSNLALMFTGFVLLEPEAAIS